MSKARAFAHVLLPRFRELSRGQGVGNLIALNERLDEILRRYAKGFRKPSVNEAAYAGRPPWRISGRSLSPLDWGGSLREAISSELHLDCSVGIAATELAARIAARLAGAGGVLCWMSGREKELFAGMPLEDLDELRPEQRERLRSAGIATLDALARLEPLEGRALLGIEGEKLLELVRGVDGSVDSMDGSGLDGAFVHLAERLSQRLDRGRFQARGLELAIDYADGVTRERYGKLPRPTSAPDELAEAAFRLYRLQARSGKPIAGVSLAATGLSPVLQLDLFRAPRAREVRVSLGRSVSRPSRSAD